MLSLSKHACCKFDRTLRPSLGGAGGKLRMVHHSDSGAITGSFELRSVYDSVMQK
jgi:hypothetical protein